MEKKLFQPRYTRSFKKKVIAEYLSTGCSKMVLIRKYNIHFKSAIQTWMRILGYTDPYRPLQNATFGGIILTTLPKKKLTEKEAEKKIRELERQLQDEKLRSEIYARIIEKAEKEYKIPITKKPDTK